MTTGASSEEHKRSLDSIYDYQTQALDSRQQALDEERRALEEWYKRGLAMLQRSHPETDSSQALFSNGDGRDRTTPPQEQVFRAKGKLSRRLRGRGSMTEEARGILDEMQNDEVFTQPIVRAKFVEKHPGSDSISLQTSISHLLRQLNKAGELERFGKEAATDPYQYRKTPKYRNRQQRDEAKLVEP